MPLLRLVLAKWRALVRRNVVADEIRDEMQFHVEMRAADYRERGLSVQNAQRAASRRFGNFALMQDRGYDVRGATLIESIAQDVRFSARLLRQQKGFSVVVITTLALAIGASTALFSVIDAALIRPLPYPDPDRLVFMNVRDREPNGQFSGGMAPSFNDLEAWRSSSTVFRFIGQAREQGFDRVIVDAGEPERAMLGHASADFLETLGIRPIIGREFSIDDTRSPVPTVALISHVFWQNRFGGDRSAIGRAVRVERDTLTIIGVLPSGFYDGTAIWQPMLQPASQMMDMRGSGTPTYGRLRPDIATEQAAREVTDLARRIAAARGESTDFDVHLQPLYEVTVSRYVSTIRMLAGAVVLILLLACINVSGLLLARGATREPELAVRASIGAGRIRLMRQLSTESLLLAALGGSCGLGLAWLLLDVLVAILPLSLPANATPSINLLVLAFATALSVATAFLFGLLPAVRLSHVHLGTASARSGRRTGPALSRSSGQFLIASEVALAIVLLTGAGLLVRSFSKALTIDLGYQPGTFLTMEVYPIDQRPAAQREYFARLLDAVRVIPGVSAVGAVDLLPLGDAASFTDAHAEGTSVFVSVKHMSPGYLEAVGLAPIQGRLPTQADGSQAAVLSESAARRLFQTGNAVGRQFTSGDRSHEVVGVVRDIRSYNAFEVDDRPDIYLSFGAAYFDSGESWMPRLVIQPAVGAAGLGDRLRQVALALGPAAIVERVRYGSDWFGDNLEVSRNRTLLLGLLGVLGLTLALVGIFGVTAYTVASRTHEIGVRMAFGARPGQIIGRVIGGTAWSMVVGIAGGLGGAYYTTRLIESFLYDTTPHDVPTFLVVALFMATAAIVAAWIPARRAARVDPVMALRIE